MKSEIMTRRAFLCSLGRGVLAMALLGGMASLLTRKGARCREVGACQDCAGKMDCPDQKIPVPIHERIQVK